MAGPNIAAQPAPIAPIAATCDSVGAPTGLLMSNNQSLGITGAQLAALGLTTPLSATQIAALEAALAWAQPTPPGTSWLTDTFNGFDIYGRGFAKTPTIFFDPSSTNSAVRGTFDSPYTSFADVIARCSGDMKRQVLGIKRGSHTYTTGTNGLGLTCYSSDADFPFVICPYGDAEALPIISGATIQTTWVAVSGNIYSKTMAESDVWQSGVRLPKQTFSVSAAATLTSDGMSTYNGGVLYIRPFNGENPNLGQVVTSAVTFAMHIYYSDVAATGNIQIAGLDIEYSNVHCLGIESLGSASSITSIGSISVVGCRFQHAGVDNVAGAGRGGLMMVGYGTASAADTGALITNPYIAGNYAFDHINNAVEAWGTNGLIFEYNYGERCGGNTIMEIWATQQNTEVRYNYGKNATQFGRLFQGFHKSGIWIANNHWDGTNWNSNDATNALNTGINIHHNIIFNASKGFETFGGTAQKFQHNTVYFDPDSYGLTDGVANGLGWTTQGTAATGFCDISNNLFYWKAQNVARGGSMVRIYGGVGAGASNPTGDKNVYFADTASGGMNWYWTSPGGPSSGSFTAYKTAVGAGLDANSYCKNLYTGGNLTAAQLGMDTTTLRPLAANIPGATTLTGIGTMYQDGQPYVAATCTIGALKGS